MAIYSTERKIRQIIREVLNADLDEMALQAVRRFSKKNISQVPSIGYREAEDDDYIERVVDLYERTKDNWVIIVLADIVYTEEGKEFFMDWFKSEFPPEEYPDAKFLVVKSSSMKGDLDAPNWLFVHDIIGHTVGKIYMDSLGFRKGSKGWYEEASFRGKLLKDIHASLDKRIFQVSDEGESQFDKLYDVFAAIVLGYLDYETAKSFAKTAKELDLVDQMFEVSQFWIDSIPKGVPTAIRPW